MKNSHWQYLEPSHVVGFVLLTFVWSFFFVLLGGLVAAFTGNWWIPIAVVLASPFAGLWSLSEELKDIQRRMEGDV